MAEGNGWLIEEAEGDNEGGGGCRGGGLGRILFYIKVDLKASQHTKAILPPSLAIETDWKVQGEGFYCRLQGLHFLLLQQQAKLLPSTFCPFPFHLD